MKIRTRLFLQHLFIAVVSILTSGLIIVTLNYNLSIKAEFKNNLRDAKMLESGIRQINSKLSAPEPLFGSIIPLMDIKTEFTQNKRVLKKWGINFNLYIKKTGIYSYIEDDSPIPDIVISSFNGKSSYMVKSIEGETLLYVTETILPEYGDIVILLKKNISHIKSNRDRQYLLLLLVTAIVSTLLIPLTLFLSGDITNPLKILIKNIQNHNKSFSDREVIKTNLDEVNRLYNEFSLMSDSIKDKIELLKMESESKEKFIYQLNHELNTPVSSIVGFSHYLLNNSYDEEVNRRSLNHIYREANRIKNLNSTLQDLHLPKGDYRWVVFNISTLIKEVILSLESITSDKSIDVIFKEIDADIKGNRELIFTLIKNILHNSLKFSSDKDKVEIVIDRIDGLKIKIRDWGPGIDEELIGRVTEPHITGNKSCSSGTGLGLSICKEIIKYHNCSFRIFNSDPGLTVDLNLTKLLAGER